MNMIYTICGNNFVLLPNSFLYKKFAQNYDLVPYMNNFQCIPCVVLIRVDFGIRYLLQANTVFFVVATEKTIIVL